MKFEDQPVITNKAPRNTKLSMDSHGVKMNMLKEDEKPEDTSVDMENGKKGEQGKEKPKEKSKKKSNKPSNKEKRPLPELPTNIHTKPENATQRPLPETLINNQTQPNNATTERPRPKTPTSNQTKDKPGNATTQRSQSETLANIQAQANNETQRPLPGTPTNDQHKPQTLQIHLPEGTESKERNRLSGDDSIKPDISWLRKLKKDTSSQTDLSIKQDINWNFMKSTKTDLPIKRDINKKLTKSTQTDISIKPDINWNLTKSTQTHTFDKKITVENRASCIILGLKGIIMIAAIFLISSSEEISNAEPCGIEKALKSISLNYTVSCTYDDIKEVSETLHYLGISLLAVNFLFFPLTLFFLLLPRICKLVVCILLPLVAIFSVFMIMEHNDILYSKTAEKDMNYVQIQSAMATWLEAHYTSDNVSSSDAISNSWNKFFIDYDCCAIHQVQGTTNDFDSTPWCTTSGSCQATASQIPKPCCNGVSEDDYGSAPSDCHSSVNPGTFRSNCMNVIKQLSAVNVEECQLSWLQMSSIIIAILEVVATVLEIIAVIIWIVLWASNKRETEKDEIVWAFAKQKSEKEDNENKKNKKT